MMMTTPMMCMLDVVDDMPATYDEEDDGDEH